MSSDLLMSLRHGLEPAERGLVKEGDVPVWSFPADYLDRLRRAVVQADAPRQSRSDERPGSQ